MHGTPGKPCRGKLTCDALSIVFLLVSRHPDFVTSNDSLKPVLLAESLSNIRSKLHAYAALARTTARLRLRVCPEHLHHQTCLTRLPLLVAIKFANVVQRNIVIREEATMEDEVLLSNQGGERQRREALGEEFEYPAQTSVRSSNLSRPLHSHVPLAVLGLALALEAIHSVHVICLVVATVDKEGVWSQPLVRVKKQRDLGGPVSSVDKIAVEEVVVLVVRLAV